MVERIIPDQSPGAGQSLLRAAIGTTQGHCAEAKSVNSRPREPTMLGEYSTGAPDSNLMSRAIQSIRGAVIASQTSANTTSTARLIL